MNQELLKSLKNAGFRLRYDVNESLEWEEPTLSELIEACGEDFAGLYKGYAFQEKPKDGKIWFCKNLFAHSINAIEFYSTPEEAVARLYLSLNPVK